MQLPDDLTSRPLTLGDASAVFAVIAAQEEHDLGEVVIEEADILGDWGRPAFDIATSTVGVFDGDRLVAYGEVGLDGRGDAAVHPDHRARGLGTAIAAWSQETARSKGYAEVGMPVLVDSAGDRLLAELGYHVRWHSWVLELPQGATVPARSLPDGYAVRGAEPSEHEAVWTVQEDAFLEWSVRARQGFPDWQAQVLDRPGFEPWNLRVVVDPDGEVVAMAWVILAGDCAFVDRLATRKDQRGRGFAQALLVDAFAVAAGHGAARSELSTDSRTGALSLYEKVGMVVTSTWVNRGIVLS